MAPYAIDPPLQLAGNPNVFIRSLDDAVAFLKECTNARRPMSQRSVLRRLEGANRPAEQKYAAHAFRFCAEGEGLLIT